MIKEKALYFAKELGLSDFKASTGWLDKFKKRHNISFGVQSGDSGEVNLSVVEGWKNIVKDLCEGYSARDIYNLDESGLFYQSTTNKTLKIKGEKNFVGKTSKNRFTICFITNLLADREPLIFIGKSKNPRLSTKNHEKPPRIPLLCKQKGLVD